MSLLLKNQQEQRSKIIIKIFMALLTQNQQEKGANL